MQRLEVIWVVRRQTVNKHVSFVITKGPLARDVSVVEKDKGKINRELYRIHLPAANEWGSNRYTYYPKIYS
jgi:hypothetical protein